MNTTPDDSAVLASHPVFSLVLVTDAAGASLPAALHEVVQLGGHIVHTVALPPAPTASTPTAAANQLVEGVPDVVLVNADDWDELLDLTRRVKALIEPAGSPLLAVMPDNPPDSPGLEQWGQLHMAGADDFVGAGSSPAEVSARVELLARFGRLQRDLAAAREQLSRNLQFDDLTQLLNRRFFFKAAHREWARSRRYRHRLACLMLEVNYLRLYNTTYGFACGDYVLRAVANIMRQWTRESDVAARFSEEKFVTLLPETDVEGAVMLRENLLRVIGQTEFLWQGQKLPVTISIGESERIATGPVEASGGEFTGGEDDAESLSVREEVAELLADADAALTVAKKGARYPALCVDNSVALPGRADEVEDDSVGPEYPGPV